MLLKEIQPLQHIRLLDKTAPQDPIPRPVLIDRPLLGRNIRRPPLLLVHVALLLQKDGLSRLIHNQLRQEHPLGDFDPPLPLPGRHPRHRHPLHHLRRIAQTPRRQVIGIPVVVDIVFILVGPRDPEYDVPPLRLRPRGPLRPKPCNPHQNFRPALREIVLPPRITTEIVDRISNRPVPVNLLEGDLPLVVTLLARHRDHRIERRPVRESQFLRIFDRLRQLPIAIQEQLPRHLLAARGQVERQTVRLRIPIGTPAILLARKSFRSDIQPGIPPRISLQQLVDAEPNPLLRPFVAADHHIAPLPPFRPRPFVRCQHRLETRSASPFGHPARRIDQLPRRMVQRRSHPHELLNDNRLPRPEPSRETLRHPLRRRDILPDHRHLPIPDPSPLPPTHLEARLPRPHRQRTPFPIQIRKLPELFVVIGILVPHIALDKGRRHHLRITPRKQRQPIRHRPQLHLRHRDDPPRLDRHPRPALRQHRRKLPRQQPPPHIQLPPKPLDLTHRQIQSLATYI